MPRLPSQKSLRSRLFHSHSPRTAAFGPHELYDLEQDPGEVNNRIDDTGCAAELERLRAGLEEWFCRYVDPAQDGSRLPVTGKGQVDFADRRNRGRRAFEPFLGHG